MCKWCVVPTSPSHHLMLRPLAQLTILPYFNSPLLCQEFQEGRHNGLLLGDSGCRLYNFLLTPYRDPQNAWQHDFNIGLKRKSCDKASLDKDLLILVKCMFLYIVIIIYFLTCCFHRFTVYYSSCHHGHTSLSDVVNVSSV